MRLSEERARRFLKGHYEIRVCIAALCFVSIGNTGCASRTVAETPDASISVPCAADAGVRTLYDLDGRMAVQPTTSGNEIVFGVANAIVAVAISDGSARTLAAASSPSAPTVLNGVIYYAAFGGSALEMFALPLEGGPPRAIPALNGFTPVAEDESALYLRDPNGIERWVPSTESATEIPIDISLFVMSIVVEGDYIYLAAEDLTVKTTANGVIARISKNGGSIDRIVTKIGVPENLTADNSAVYWVEAPAGAAPSGRVARYSLSGGSVTTLATQGELSLVASNGRLFFSDGVTIKSMPSAGGAVTPVATGLSYAGLLTVLGNNVVWIDPFAQAASGTVSEVMRTVCAIPQ